MTWLTPWTGLFLALAVIPPLVLLYFLKLRRKPQPIACTLLWKRSVEDLQANAPFQRIRWNVLLLLQLLALLLLILSVMQPRVQAGHPAGGRTVFLIDNSASMSATDGPGGMTRLELAKRAAIERIEAMYTGGLFAGAPGEAMVVAFSDRAEVFAQFTNSRQQLVAAVERIPQTHGETRIGEAMQLARAYTMNVVDEAGEWARPMDDPPHLELFSDGRIEDLGDQALRGASVPGAAQGAESLTYHAIGTADADNVALVAISAERPFDRPNAVEVFASLVNYNRFEVRCDVQLSVNGTARGINSITIPAAGTDPTTGALIPTRSNVVFTPFEQPVGAVIEVANLREDHMMADNIAQLVVPPPRRLSVAVVTAGRADFNIYSSAIEGMPIIERIEILRPQTFERLAEQAGDAPIDGYDVIVFDNFQPETLPPGRYLTFGAAPPVDGLNEFGDTQGQLILDARDDHPVMRFANMDNVFIQSARLLAPADDVEVLATMSTGPAILTLRRGAMHLVHVAFDVLDTTWPFEFSYVTFLQNAIHYLGHSGEAVTAAGFRPGEALTTRLPATATDIELRTPDGRIERLTPLDPAQLSWGPTVLSGVHWLSWNEQGARDRQRRALAVNLLSETEGMLAVEQDIQIGQDFVAGRPVDSARYVPLWPWALGLCLALLMIEWWVYHRKTAV